MLTELMRVAMLCQTLTGLRAVMYIWQGHIRYSCMHACAEYKFDSAMCVARSAGQQMHATDSTWLVVGQHAAWGL